MTGSNNLEYLRSLIAKRDTCSPWTETVVLTANDKELAIVLADSVSSLVAFIELRDSLIDTLLKEMQEEKAQRLQLEAKLKNKEDVISKIMEVLK